MDFFDNFQFIYMIVFWSIFLYRTFSLRIVHQVKPISLGVGKRGWNAVLEISFLIGLVLWTIEVVRIVVDIKWQLFPEMLTSILFQAGTAKVLGAILLVFGILFFLFALRDYGSPGESVSINDRRAN